MKTLPFITCVIALVATPLIAADPVTPADQQLAATIKEIQTQQTQMTENQAKIDTKLATVAEAVRQARIYSSRGGR